MVCTKSSLVTAEEVKKLIDAATANSGGANKFYDVTVTGYYQDDSSNTVNATPTEGKLIIDASGNFTLDIYNLDNMANYNSNQNHSKCCSN